MDIRDIRAAPVSVQCPQCAMVRGADIDIGPGDQLHSPSETIIFLQEQNIFNIVAATTRSQERERLRLLSFIKGISAEPHTDGGDVLETPWC